MSIQLIEQSGENKWIEL
jgi:hypothetical protein